MAEEEQIELELDKTEDTEVEVPQPEKKEDEAPVVASEAEDNFDKAENATQNRIER